MTRPKSISVYRINLNSARRALTYDLSLTIALIAILSLIGNILNVSYLTTWANPWNMSIPTSCLFLLSTIGVFLPLGYRRITGLLVFFSAFFFRYIDYSGYAIATSTMQSFFGMALFFSNPKASLGCVIIPLWICFVGFSISFLKIQIPIMELFIREMSVPTMVSSIMTSILLINAPFPKALSYNKLQKKTLGNAIAILGFWIFLATLIHYSSASISQSIFSALLALSVAWIHILLQSRSQLKEFNHNLELALNKTSSLVIVDKKGIIKYANKRYFHRAGLPEKIPDDIYYQDSFQKLSHKNTFQEKLQELKPGEIWQGEFCSLDEKNNPYWEETILTPTKNEKDAEERFLIIAYDITQRVYQNQTLEENRKELYQLMENNATLIHMRSRLLQTSTHKMKAPLNQILSEISGMMIQTSPRDKVYNHLDNLRSKTQKVIHELNDILKFESETRKERYYNLSQFNLEETLYSEIEILKPEIEVKSLNFDYSCDQVKQIYHAKPAIEHIMRILLRNAYERSTEHGFVRIALRTDASNLLIRVEDHGPNISDSMQDKLLNAFHTRNLISADQKTTVGLGLSFVKELTHGLKGKVDLVNLSPSGICITVSLPMKHKSNIEAEKTVESVKKPL